MGKWEKLKTTLLAMPIDAVYQAKVDEAKKPFKDFNADKLAIANDRSYRRKKQLEDTIALINVELEATNQLMLDRMDAEGADSVTTRSGIKFTKSVSPYPYVSDRGEFFGWIKRTRQVEFLSVNSQRLGSLVRELLEQGQKMPPGIDAFLKTTVKRRGKSNHKEDKDDKDE